MYLCKSYESILKFSKEVFVKMWSVLFFCVSLFWPPFYVALWLSYPVLFPVDSEGLAAIPLTMCFCFVDRMSVSFCCFEIVIVIITVGSISMDRFVKKSAVKSLKRQNSGKEYDKEYDGKKRKRIFQSTWLAEFPWLTLDKDRGIMKLKRDCFILFVHVLTVYTHWNSINSGRNRSKCCVLCKFGFIKIIPLKHSANQMSYVFIYYH